MSYIIGSKCIGVKDGICIEVCPIDECIVEGGESMYINPELCINCGMCLGECPVQAIYDSEDSTIQNNEFQAVINNYQFFNLQFK